MSPIIRFGLIGLGAGLLLGSIYFSLKNQDLSFLSANVVSVKNPVEEINLASVRSTNNKVITGGSSAKALPVAQRPTCSYDASASSSVYLNEVAWMGSGLDAKAEWLEIKNFSSSSISLDGWQILDKTQNIKLFISGNIEGNGFRVFSRGSDFTGTINNSDEVLNLFNSKCELVDEVRATPAWPAGKSDGRTAERGSDLNWHTSSEIGGTPNAENSAPTLNFSSVQSTFSTSSDSASFVSSSSNIGPALPNKVSAGPNQVLISEVMVGNDVSGSYEFIELYNAGAAAADLSGWNIKKISSTGSESSLVSKTRLEGVKLPAGKHLLLANEKGYIAPPSADIFWPGSYSLAYKENGVNLYNSDGILADELYWPEIPKNQSYNRTSWDAANFKLGSPTPQNSK